MMLAARRFVLAAAVVTLLAGASYARGAPAQALPVTISASQVNPKRPNIGGFLAARIAGKGAQKYLSDPLPSHPAPLRDDLGSPLRARQVRSSAWHQVAIRAHGVQGSAVCRGHGGRTALLLSGR